MFAAFDELMILSGGSVAYSGKANEMTSYLRMIGRPVPMHTNPAEFVMQLVNADFAPKEEVDQVVAAWTQPPARAQMISPLPPLKGETPTWVQLEILFSQTKTVAFRDPYMYAARVPFLVFVTFFMCYNFIETRNTTQDQVQRRSALVWTLTVLAPLGGTFFLYALWVMNPLIKRDIKHGMYSALNYCIVFTFVQIPASIISAMAFIVAPYTLGGWHLSSLFNEVVIVACLLFSFENAAQYAITRSGAYLICSQTYGQLMGASMFFSAYMLPARSIIWPIQIFCWILPVRWAAESTAYALFIDADYSEAFECATCPRGFTCEEHVPGASCYGFNGYQILVSLAARFDCYHYEDRVLGCILIILYFGFILKLFHYKGMARVSGKKVEPPVQVFDEK
jgi:hypothetical protein